MPNKGRVIRPAVSSDAPTILRLIKELAEFEKLSHEVVATENGLAEQLFGAQPGAEVLIGEWDGEPVAFALFFHNFSTFLGRRGIYLEDLYVKPASRSQGFGRAMLAKLANIARERGCGRLEWSVLDWNKRAIDFYVGLGAIPLADWTMFRVTGAALERLAIDAPCGDIRKPPA